MSVVIKILRFLGSLLLIPVCVAATASFYKEISGIKMFSDLGLTFILGALAYSLLHILLFKLDFLYVLGHELMHALGTLFSGGKVMSIKVSSEGGSVKTTTPNFFVMLAPYLIPAYTVFVAVVYFTASFFMDVDKYSSHFIFLAGFTLMFHLAYTARSIKERQSDLMKAGYLFSISFIYIINIAIVFAIISLLFKEASFFDFLSSSYERSKGFYGSFWRQLF